MRLTVVVLALVSCLAMAGTATAHPLGNFTVNRYAEAVVSGDRLYVRYALDLAEIPTVQEGARVRARGFAAELGRRLEVRVDGARVSLRPLASEVHTRPGAGGLRTLRFDAVYDAGPAGRRLALRDRSFEGRLGWREVVVRAERGAGIARSDVPARSASKALRSYSTRDPLDVRGAVAVVVPGDAAGVPPALAASPDAPGRAEALVAGELSAGVVAVSLLLALFWGAAHALSPGHGKAIVAGYLVGARGTARHALLLGAIVTATHTVGVFALGLVTLALSSVLLPEQLYPWLNLVAALLVVGVGVGVVRARLAHARGHHHHDHHQHDHDHGLSGRSLLGVGISGGIVPCPTALVVLLGAISLHRVGFGLVLIVAFSIGLAASIAGIGLVAVAARGALSRVGFDGRLVRALPAVSAVLVLALGVAMTARALVTLA
jgi:ABC-type nickel/cobalt efflux system permease component RcnA